MPSPEKKHTGLRIVTAGSIAALGVVGAAIGKTVIEELSKPKVIALEEQQPEGITPSQKAFNELVTVTPSPSPSPEPTATTTEVAKKEKCLVFDDCSKVEFFIKPNADGEDVLYAGANLEPGTIIYARRSGQRGAIDLPKSSSVKGTRMTIRNPNLIGNDPEGVDYITGDIIPVDYNSVPVEKGEPIGKIGKSGAKNDGYNFIHTIGKVNPTTGKAITDVEKLKETYGNNSGKPIKKVSRDLQTPGPLIPGPPVFEQ